MSPQVSIKGTEANNIHDEDRLDERADKSNTLNKKKKL
jgi:hypothetical protein